ncbi:hypothetical protein [Sphingomonas psychrolutea]|uniref:DUF4239 domain-containing protein n=1 Tax=Sphingomonas psychrolutea TaxID=1259676 RepID=A0ABQ1H6N6_9SPHN|nr:hypothetical protein [Sphingomonas psychrolutea]GGA60133.1 hypothetical protein GCM10011395_33140 [Sphingomonas psychrolutea]
MKWTILRQLSQSQAVYWAFGLWIPVITGVLLARAGALVTQYPDFARIHYPSVVFSAFLLALAGTAWAIFATVCNLAPDAAIREHKSQAEYLEKCQKAYSGDDWPPIFTALVQKWERTNRLNLTDVALVTVLLVLAFTLAALAFWHLLTAISPLIAILIHR